MLELGLGTLMPRVRVDSWSTRGPRPGRSGQGLEY
jgi:hypothetical protein